MVESVCKKKASEFSDNRFFFKSGCPFAKKQLAASQRALTPRSGSQQRPKAGVGSNNQSHSEACVLTRILKASANQVQTPRVEAFFCFG